jgi:hypothetical protein
MLALLAKLLPWLALGSLLFVVGWLFMAVGASHGAINRTRAVFLLIVLAAIAIVVWDKVF